MLKSNTELKEAITWHFSKLYTENLAVCPKLDGLPFNKIFETSRQWLEAEFSEQEVFDGLKSCNGNKTPGPD